MDEDIRTAQEVIDGLPLSIRADFICTHDELLPEYQLERHVFRGRCTNPFCGELLDVRVTGTPAPGRPWVARRGVN